MQPRLLQPELPRISERSPEIAQYVRRKINEMSFLTNRLQELLVDPEPGSRRFRQDAKRLSAQIMTLLQQLGLEERFGGVGRSCPARRAIRHQLMLLHKLKRAYAAAIANETYNLPADDRDGARPDQVLSVPLPDDLAAMTAPWKSLDDGQGKRIGRQAIGRLLALRQRDGDLNARFQALRAEQAGRFTPQFDEHHRLHGIRVVTRVDGVEDEFLLGLTNREAIRAAAQPGRWQRLRSWLGKRLGTANESADALAAPPPAAPSPGRAGFDGGARPESPSLILRGNRRPAILQERALIELLKDEHLPSRPNPSLGLREPRFAAVDYALARQYRRMYALYSDLMACRRSQLECTAEGLRRYRSQCREFTRFMNAYGYSLRESFFTLPHEKRVANGERLDRFRENDMRFQARQKWESMAAALRRELNFIADARFSQNFSTGGIVDCYDTDGRLVHLQFNKEWKLPDAMTGEKERKAAHAAWKPVPGLQPGEPRLNLLKLLNEE
ncbi:hypothetical protein [Noviherbaspirillum galbum]|uniref:Uncharacterized protein n=1 Tax=Noviherbaspirillum galbum TaxID=2709383 RepID=A0A6B3SQ62_9BURK|nr:hypothetical protein [Noviherbaspirillum galbum]NEX61445.1 hypothetical protein [Noviherbaspirillum galbum]